MKTSLLLAAALVLAGVSSARAHDLWLEPDSVGVKAVYGHAGEGEGAERSRLFAVEAVLPGGKVVSLLDGVKPAGKTMPPLALPPAAQGARLIAARYDGGFWVKTPAGSRNTNRLNIPDALESMWSRKFATLILPGVGPLPAALGRGLEIVPLADPLTLKPGAALKVRVDLDGKPLAGVALTHGDPAKEEVVKAEADGTGVASVILRPGLNLLTVSRRVPGSAPALAAEDALAATLAFDIR